MFHLLLLPSLVLAVQHGRAVQHTRHTTSDDEMRLMVEKLHDVVEQQGDLIEGLERTVLDQSERIQRLRSENRDHEAELKTVRQRLKALHRKVGNQQWDSIHVSAAAACSHLKPTMTKTVLPFVEEVSCATVCATSNTRYTTCLAMIRFNVLKTGRMEEAVPFGEVWVRADACWSSSYTLGTELLKDDISGYYTVCCCGL